MSDDTIFNRADMPRMSPYGPPTLLEAVEALVETTDSILGRLKAVERRDLSAEIDFAPLHARIDTLFALFAELRKPAGIDESAIERIVDARVHGALAALPKPEPVDLSGVTARIDAAFAALANFRQPKDGKSVTTADLAPLVAEAVGASKREMSDEEFDKTVAALLGQ